MDQQEEKLQKKEKKPIRSSYIISITRLPSTDILAITQGLRGNVIYTICFKITKIRHGFRHDTFLVNKVSKGGSFFRLL